MARSLLRCRRRQLLLAVWIALMVVSTVTVGLGVLGVHWSSHATVTDCALADEGTGSSSGIDPARSCESLPASTARSSVIDGAMPADSVQSTSTRWLLVGL